MQIVFRTNNAQLITSVNRFIDDWNDDSPTVSVKTSGSTGKPKTINLSKKRMAASARMTGDFLNLPPESTALLCLSPDTIAGKMMLVRSLVLNLKLIISDVNSSPMKGIDIPIDFAAMVPLQVESLLRKTPSDLTKIRKLIVGGGSISDYVWQGISDTKVEAYQTFGMTETISHIAMRRISKEMEPYAALPGIWLSSKNERLIITAHELGLEKLETNDLVDLIDSSHFYWKGRADFVINSGGIKLQPEQIEQKLEGLITLPYFSTGLRDETLGEKHIICIEDSEPHYSKADFARLLDPYAIPKEIYGFQSFVYTESGKINRPETLKTISNAQKQVL